MKKLQNNLWLKLSKNQRNAIRKNIPELGKYFDNRTAIRIQRPILHYLGEQNKGRLAYSKYNTNWNKFTYNAIKREFKKTYDSYLINNNDKQIMIKDIFHYLGGIDGILSKLSKNELVNLARKFYGT